MSTVATPPGTKPDVTFDDYDLAVLEHVTRHFRLGRRGLFGGREEVHALDDITLGIRSGEVLGLVGESGSGKSTLARLLLGLVRADSGRIEVDQIDVRRLAGVQLRALRRSAQLVFQDAHGAMDPRMTLGQSLLAPLSQHRIGTSESRRELVLKGLDEVGLDASFVDKYPGQCSGGQLQRAVIARALLLEPRLLVCDEPTSALDASVQSMILNLLVDLRRRRDLTVLMISHDLRVVRFISDRVAVMYLGEIVEVAPTAELFERAVHPYTLALLSAALPTQGEEAPVIEARGEPPSPIHPPPGCRFNTRCPIATDRCRTEAPELEQIDATHQVRCHYWQESRGRHGLDTDLRAAAGSTDTNEDRRG